MLRTTIFAAAFCMMAMPFACATVNGQHYADNSYAFASASTSDVGFYSRHCGRRISTGQAAALWAGYCNEDCSYNDNSCGRSCCGIGMGGCFGKGKCCGLFSRKSRGCGCGCGDTVGGGFGWNCGGDAGGCGGACDTGCGDSCGASKGCGGKLRGLFAKLKGGCCNSCDPCGGKSCRLGKFFRKGSGCGCSSCYQGCFDNGCQVSAAPAQTSSVCGVTDVCSGGCGFDCGSGCGCGCKGGKLKSVGGRVFGAAKRVASLPFGIAKKVCSGCGQRCGGKCGCGGGMFKSAIGRVGCSGYDGGYFYDSPATTNQFNLCTPGCGSATPAADAVDGGDAVPAGVPAGDAGATSNGSLSPGGGVLPGNVVGDGN